MVIIKTWQWKKDMGIEKKDMVIEKKMQPLASMQAQTKEAKHLNI
jgi:hypothetical protein